jgi:hypothetical protein
LKQLFDPSGPSTHARRRRGAAPARLLAGIVAALAVSVFAFFLWMARLPPFDGYADPVDAAFEDLHVDLHETRVKGTAHYPVVVSVNRAGSFGRPDETWWLYPLFAPGDTMGRTIYALVMARSAPEELIGFEDMTLECDVRPPRVGISPEAELAFRNAGYTFAPDYVLLEQLPIPVDEDP